MKKLGKIILVSLVCYVTFSIERAYAYSFGPVEGGQCEACEIWIDKTTKGGHGRVNIRPGMGWGDAEADTIEYVGRHCASRGYQATATIVSHGYIWAQDKARNFTCIKPDTYLEIDYDSYGVISSQQNNTFEIQQVGDRSCQANSRGYATIKKSTEQISSRIIYNFECSQAQPQNKTYQVNFIETVGGYDPKTSAPTQQPNTQTTTGLTEPTKNEDREWAVVTEKESKIRAKAEAKEAKKLAEQQRIEQDRAEKEAKKFAVLQKLELLKSEKDAKEQERRRLAEEKRLARVGDGTSDDYTCKSLGAKPSTDPYIQCRLKLTEQFNQRQLEQQQMQQNRRIQDEQERLYQEQNREIQAEQKRLYQEQIQIQQRQQAEFEKSQRAAEKRRKLEALGDIFRAMEGSPQSRPSVSPTMPHFLRSQWYSQGDHMCSYDDGNVVNVGADICPIQR